MSDEQRRRVELTADQRQVLTRRYQAVQEAEAGLQEARAVANDVILAIAGQGATAAVEDGQVVVYAPPEPDEDG